MKKLSSRFLSTDERTTERVTIHNRVLFGVERKELFDKHGRLQAVEQVSHRLSNAVEFLRYSFLDPSNPQTGRTKWWLSLWVVFIGVVFQLETMKNLWKWLMAIIYIWYHSYRCLNLITVANSISSFTTVENGVGGGRERERGLKGKGSECL